MTSHRILLPLVSVALLLSACDFKDTYEWAINKETAHNSFTGTEAHSRVVFWRTNTAGGSDLLATTADGATPIANLTDHVLDQVDLGSPPIYVESKNRVVYGAGRAGVVNLFTVLAAQDGTSPAQSLTSFGLGQIQDFAVVGDYVVVDATVDGIQNLWSVPVDGSRELRRLSNNLLSKATIRWNENFQAEQRWIYFEYETSNIENGDITTAVLTADLASGAGAVPITVAQDIATISTTTNPLASDGTMTGEVPIRIGRNVVLRTQDRAGSRVQFELADVAVATSKPITRAFATANETLRLPQLVGERLVFVRSSVDGFSENLCSVPMSGGSPETVLTGFAGQSGAPQAIDYALTPLGNTLVGVAVQPDAATPGNHFVEVFSVEADRPESFAMLSDRNAYAGTQLAADDIDLADALVIGRAVVFSRGAFPEGVFQAVVGKARSETTLFSAAETRAHTLRDEVVRQTVAGVALWQRPVLAGFVDITMTLGSDAFVNLTALRDGGDAVHAIALSSQAVTAGPIVHRGFKGNRTVYTRGGTIYSADFTKAGSELVLSASTTTLTAVHVFPGKEGSDRIFFQANGQMFSAPVNLPVENGRVRALTALLPSVQSITAVHFASTSRVVFTVATASIATLTNSMVDPVRPAPTDVSRAVSTADVFLFSL